MVDSAIYHRMFAGAIIVIRFQGVGEDARIIIDQLRRLGFRDIKNFSGAAIEAVK